MPAPDAGSLTADQKKWIAERDHTCGVDVSGTKAGQCLRKSYEDRIKAVSHLKRSAPYGALRFRIVGRDAEEPVQRIGELFDETFKREGPLRREIKCDTTTPDSFCPGLEAPDAANTVIIEYGSGGAATGFSARYRSLLTDTDGGSEHLMNPVVALDFEYADERGTTPDGRRRHGHQGVIDRDGAFADPPSACQRPP